MKRVLEARARLIIPANKGKTGILYIPADIVKDSSFPFEPNETVIIKIEGEKLIIEKDEGNRKQEKG
ncbi:MAG: hypothetical protein QW569_01735 [Candidatus Bathyarchaeia archaeon]|nr:hypothetical protein [Candidatus Bathyarchaeota archaeon]